MRAPLFTTLLAATLALVAPAVLAQDKPTPESLHDAGVAALNADDWEKACANFRASLALAERASVLVRLGDCALHAKNPLEAWKLWQQARLVNNADSGGRRPEIEKEIIANLNRISTLEVRVSPKPSDVVVTVDGKSVPTDDIGVPFPVEAGDHRVTAEAPDYAAVEAKVIVSPTLPKQHVVSLTLSRLGPPPPPPPPPMPHSQQRVAGYILSGAGLLTLGAAGVLGLMTLSRVSESNPHCEYPDGSCDATGVSLRNEASRLQTAGLIVGAAGAVALSTGVMLFVTAPPSTTAAGDARQLGAYVRYTRAW